MEKKNIKIIGAVCSIFGLFITIYGQTKYSSAKGMYRTASWFGENNTSDNWKGYMSNYKIFIIVGSIVLLIGLIVLISGFLLNTNDEQKIKNSSADTSDKLVDLQKMLNSNLITQEEFEDKRKKILDSM